MMVEYAKELVVHWSSNSQCHNIWATKPRLFSASAISGGGRETLTRWYFELGIKPDMFINFYYANGSRVVCRAVKMEVKYGWKQLDQNLNVRFAQAGLVGLRPRDACECVFYSVHRIVLLSFDISHEAVCVDRMVGG